MKTCFLGSHGLMPCPRSMMRTDSPVICLVGLEHAAADVHDGPYDVEAVSVTVEIDGLAGTHLREELLDTAIVVRPVVALDAA